MSVLLAQATAAALPLRDGCVQCCVTSPPYWGLRSYKTTPQVWGGEAGCEHEWGSEGPCHHPGQVEQTKWKAAEAAGHGQTAGSGAFCRHCGAWRGELGLEPTPDLYVQHMVAVFREVRRVLRPDGIVFLNLGDSYCASGGNTGGASSDGFVGRSWNGVDTKRGVGLKPKDLVGIPWRVAFALQADGWWLRSDIIWAKPNPMPESVQDRPTRSHEYVFLLTKAARYFWDAEAVAEPSSGLTGGGYSTATHEARRAVISGSDVGARIDRDTRNARSVWTIPTRSYPGAHFATMPPALAERCILAGSKPGSIVLDPFAGSGTVGRVAIKHGRRFVGIDLQPTYISELAPERLSNIQLQLREASA